MPQQKKKQAKENNDYKNEMNFLEWSAIQDNPELTRTWSDAGIHSFVQYEILKEYVDGLEISNLENWVENQFGGFQSFPSRGLFLTKYVRISLSDIDSIANIQVNLNLVFDRLAREGHIQMWEKSSNVVLITKPNLNDDEMFEYIQSQLKAISLDISDCVSSLLPNGY